MNKHTCWMLDARPTAFGIGCSGRWHFPREVCWYPRLFWCLKYVHRTGTCFLKKGRGRAGSLLYTRRGAGYT